MKNPKVSVVMIVHNGERYVGAAVRSILRQTLKDFEFIIVNDGSTDNTARIIEGFTDKRIRLIYNRKKTSPAKARNIGLVHANGKYIAIMDSDDISLPQRLTKQVKYLDRHPKIGILGTAHQRIDKKGLVIGKTIPPLDPGLVKWCILMGYSFTHSTVMMRRDVIEQLSGYSEVPPPVEDYDLWSRAIFVTRVANMKDILLRWRFWENNCSYTNYLEGRRFYFKAVHTVVSKLLHKRVDKKKTELLSALERGILLPDSQFSAGVDKRIIRCASELSNGIAMNDFRLIESVAEVIRKMHRVYLKTHRLSRREKKLIVRNIFEKLFILATLARKLSVSDEKVLSLFKL